MNTTSSKPLTCSWDERAFLCSSSGKRVRAQPVLNDLLSNPTAPLLFTSGTGLAQTGASASQAPSNRSKRKQQSKHSRGKTGPDEAQAEEAPVLPCLLQTTAPKGARNAVAKKAETLFLCLSDVIARNGLERVAFHTLTFAKNVTCREKAQKHFHSYATHFLAGRVKEWICNVERQGRGAIHFHLIIAFDYDVRRGFDFEKCIAANRAKKRGNLTQHAALMREVYPTANRNLRNWWTAVRENAPKYGFGRCETLPILSNSEAVARYVGSYVGTELAGRQLRDKGLRTIRYAVERRAATIRWAWAGGPAQEWRRGCHILSVLLDIGDDFTPILGNRWAYNWREEIALFGRHYDTCLQVCAEICERETNLRESVVRVTKLAECIRAWETSGANKACQKSP